jgi:alkanesulfonate monooxygenase SsuD/methylene tetrahydromethanopterin reductase-like flavin-dependent oxidoreductase (luciferase family)
MAIPHKAGARPIGEDRAGKDRVVEPLSPGTISMRLYPHGELPASRIVDEMRSQAALAQEHGFDGVMTSEHHGGLPGYSPNPLQLAGWLLEAMPGGWAAACPLLLPLRPVALVAEEVAWLAARFPDRVGVGVAAGALGSDFEIMGVSQDDLAARFAAALDELAGILGGTRPGRLADDPAVDRCRKHPVPVVSAAIGLTAARRAAGAGVGILLDSLATTERCHQVTDAYREAGGTGPCILIRRAWLGHPPRDRLDRQVEVYRGFATATAQSHWSSDQLVNGTDATMVGDQLADVAHRAGADALNLRVQVPGVTPGQAREQIMRLGSEVLPLLRQRLARQLR